MAMTPGNRAVAERASAVAAVAASTEIVPASAARDVELVAGEVVRVFRTTDLGNGERLEFYGQGKLRYVHGVGWLVWDGRRWQRDEGDIKVTQMAERVVRAIATEAVEVEQQAANVLDPS